MNVFQLQHCPPLALRQPKRAGSVWRSIAMLAWVGLVPNFSVAGNLVSGDCAALVSHIASPGVEDAHGVKHPGFAGWTVAEFAYVSIPTDRPRSRNIKADVPPAPNCLHAWIRAEFTAKPLISTLQWVPSATACNRCECEERAAVWHNDYAVHENAHAQQAHDLAAEWTAKWQQPRHYDYCGRVTGQASHAMLNARISNALEEEVRLLTLEFDRRGAALDAVGATGVALPDCGVDCASCKASEVPQMCAAVGQRCSLGTCVQDVCCRVVESWGLPGQSSSLSWMSAQACGELNQGSTVARIVPNCNCAGGCP